MADLLKQFFGDVPRACACAKTFTAAAGTDDLTGMTLRCVFEDKAAPGTYLLDSAATTSGLTVSAANATQFVLTFNKTATWALAPNFDFGVVKTNAGGEEPLAAGYGRAFTVPGLGLS